MTPKPTKNGAMCLDSRIKNYLNKRNNLEWMICVETFGENSKKNHTKKTKIKTKSNLFANNTFHFWNNSNINKVYK